MNKLGIAIKSTLMGSGEPFAYNRGPWESKVVDVRDALRHVPSLASDPGRAITFFSFSESGCYITVARCYPNREGDNIAGWIFVPAEIRISGEELLGNIRKIKDLIFRTELPGQAELQQLFSQTYPLKTCSIPYKASLKNGKFAKREITPTVSEEKILSNLHQPYYAEFQAVFIEERPNEVVGVTDLSHQPLTNLVPILPPDPAILRSQGIEVFFLKTGETFANSMLVPVGSTIKIGVKRRGFETQSFVMKVDSEGTKCEIPEINWQRKISKSDFIVKDSSGRQLNSGYTIYINNQPLIQDRYLTEFEIETARVRVEYQNQSTAVTGNLKSLPMTVYIDGPVGKSSRGAEWRVVLANGSKGKVAVEGNGVAGYESPLKGYDIDGEYLVYKDNAWTQRIIGFAAGIILGGIVVGILALCGAFGSSDDKNGNQVPAGTETTVDIPAAETGQQQLNDDVQKALEEKEKAALTYLEENQNWKKGEMEQIDNLQGLFDDLNTFNLEQLSNKWMEILKGSPRFLKIIEAYKISQEKGGKPQTKTPDFTYNKAGDETINIDNYIKWISVDCIPGPANETHANDKQVNVNGGNSGNRTVSPQETISQPKEATNTQNASGSGINI